VDCTFGIDPMLTSLSGASCGKPGPLFRTTGNETPMGANGTNGAPQAGESSLKFGTGGLPAYAHARALPVGNAHA
jgi:hypothetical protein